MNDQLFDVNYVDNFAIVIFLSMSTKSESV